MGGARIDLQPAWVLKATPYRDTSLLLECLTLDHGRVGLVARGARGPRTRTRALLQAFLRDHPAAEERAMQVVEHLFAGFRLI